MLNPFLMTFLTVADCGSFTKASKQLYISPTAVMKQIDALESHLELKLLERTPQGVHLTPAGEVIRRDGKFLSDYVQRSLANARAASEAADTTFCVGTSLLNPAKPFMDLWYLVSREFPGYKLHLVPFEDEHRGILREIGQLGEKFDFLVGVCNSRAWLDQCRMLPLGMYRAMVAVRREHPLAGKERLEVADLYGQTLMMVKEGDSGLNDQLRADLRAKHPQIRLEDTPYFYDMSVFNRCAETGNLLLTLECWQDVHPGLVSIPVNWDYAIPYGLLYALDPPSDVERFVQAVKRVCLTGEK
ncbi:LysR family transcriptional regulator [Flavonifractor sp. HCP28S3_F3]|uniref:LysR family transcriptional regulator n=1 Tax=Flavonifractor sp. HCP28S3_F3 TaxID=3438939 RepID=UPI003F8B654A